MHLARQANGLDRARVDIALGKRLPDRLDGGAPPVLGVLLCPRRLRRSECDVVRRRRPGDAAVAGNEDRT
jgi:hypothetical protein